MDFKHRRLFPTEHANYASNKSTQEQAVVALRLAANLHTQQIHFLRQILIQELSTKASYLLLFPLKLNIS